MKRPGYREAVRWIALNDEPTEHRIAEMERLISVALIADLFDVTTLRVARDVIHFRGRLAVKMGKWGRWAA